MSEHYELRLRRGDVEIQVCSSDRKFTEEKFEELISKTKHQKSPAKEETHSSDRQENPHKKQKTGMERLAFATGVSVEELSPIFDFIDGEIIIYKTSGSKMAEKQSTTAKLALIAHEHLKNNPLLSSMAITPYLENLGVSTSHLSRALKDDSGINMKGRSYKLNHIGRKAITDTIKRLI